MLATKNGFLYIYVSNEGNLPVYFDNLSVTHTPGPILEETHYYPFGLTTAGISSKALKANYAENKKKFNGIEQTTELDLNQYDAFFRNMDPQIGRWWQIDPKPNVSISPYAAMDNNPIFNFDPLGDTIITSKNVQNNSAAAAAVSLFKQSETFQSLYGQFDVGGENGFFSGGENGAQSGNTNIVFDTYDNPKQGGLTKVEIQDKDGNWVQVKDNADPSTIDKDSKVMITFYVDTKTHKTTEGYANTFNHEASAHGAPFLKTLATLRQDGASGFAKELRGSYQFSFADKGKGLQNAGYNVAQVQHGRIGAGENPYYLSISKELRNQMSPTQQKNYDRVVNSNVQSYGGEIPAYRFFVPKK